MRYYRMKQRTKAFFIIGALCGLICMVGFGLFPVLHVKDTLLNNVIISITDSLSSGRGHDSTSWNLVYSLFRDVDSSSVLQSDDIAIIYGYKNAVMCVILFCLPLLGAAGLFIAGIAKSGIGLLISGILTACSYAAQMITFPDGIGEIADTFEFSVWQYLLIGIAVLGFIMGLIECLSPKPIVPEQQPPQTDDSYNETVYHTDSAYTVSKHGVLTGIRGEFEGASVPLNPGDTITIGRNSDSCNLILQDKSVSRIHCYVRFDDKTDEYYVTDVSSLGVFDVDGNAIAKNVEVGLKPGSQIRIGQSTNEFRLE